MRKREERWYGFGFTCKKSINWAQKQRSKEDDIVVGHIQVLGRACERVFSSNWFLETMLASVSKAFASSRLRRLFRQLADRLLFWAFLVLISPVASLFLFFGNFAKCQATPSTFLAKYLNDKFNAA